MPFTPEQTAELKAKLSADAVRKRQQAGRSFSYVEGWHVIAEANRIFGFDAWDRETVEMRQLGEPREVDGKFRIAYMAKVKVVVRAEQVYMVCREGTGYGSGIDKDLGSAHESAIKEAETDAMKRALMTFGNPFGLALYDKDQENVEHAKPAPARAPSPPPVANGLAPNGGADSDLRKLAKDIDTAIKEAPDAHQLDLVMDLNQATMKRMPDTTQKYLTNLYERRRDALESVA